MRIPTKRFSEYGSVLRESWRRLWEYPLLFFPIVYRLIGFAVLGSFLLVLARVFIGTQAWTTDVSSPTKILFLALLVLLLLLFELNVKSLQIAIFSRVAAKKRIVLKEALKQSWSSYGRVAGVVLLLAIAALIVFSIVAGLILMSAGLAQSEAQVPLLMVIIGLIALGGFILALFFSAWIVFWTPSVSFTNKGSVQLLRYCWELLWKDGRHVWSTYLIKLGISIGIGIILSILSSVLTGVIGKSNIWWIVFHFIINSVVATWMMLFVFSAYFQRYKPKVV